MALSGEGVDSVSAAADRPALHFCTQDRRVCVCVDVCVSVCARKKEAFLLIVQAQFHVW